MCFRSAIVVGLVYAGGCFANDLPKTAIPFERYFQYPLLNGRSPTGAEMSPDGSKIVFGWNRTGDRKLDVWLLDYATGEKKQILSASDFNSLPRQDDTRTQKQLDDEKMYDGGIGAFQWSPDSKEILFSYKGRTWLCDVAGKNLHPIFDANMGAAGFQFSQDGKYLAYQSDTNIFRIDRKTGFVKQLTFMSKPNTSIDGFLWSPDSKYIAITWSDDSKLGKHVMMDFTKDRAVVVPITRMWNGDKSQDVQVGAVSSEGGIVRWIAGLPRNMWITDMAWSPDSSMIAMDWISEDFQQSTVSVAPIETLKKADAYHEKAPKNYIPDFRHCFWSRDSKRIFFTTDILDGKFGNRSLMSVSPSGQDLKKVFSENYDIANAMRPKDSDRLILTTQSKSPLQVEITTIEIDGKRKVIRANDDGQTVPIEFDQSGLPLVSDDGTKMASMVQKPTMNSELYSLEPKVKRLTESQREEFKQIKWADFKEVTFTAKDGVIVHATLITNPNLDKTKKHPAFLSNIYANSAKMSWGGYVENYAAMELGMVVLKVDFRSSWGLGGELNSGYYKTMGLVDADEAVAAKDYLVSLGYVNPDRVGIWGWSYGGYLTCMTLLTKPGVFHAGVAVAPVTDWKSYNEWYTRRRIGLVTDEKEAFEKTSPITYADGLKDHLLLIHGILDDNVLFQDTARLMQRMIEKGEYFDLMAYPEDNHSIGKNWSRPHVFGKIIRYLWDQLGD